jgi:tetratricopeptide (TPR) repeat protein
MNARNKGDMEEAQRLRERSIENWNKSENAYNNTKKLAPNYVQTHHQLGMLNIKRAEQAARWGELVAAKKYYEEAEKDFRKYRMLDPVFPPNYDRLVQLLLMQGKIDEVIELYKQAIHYNDVIGKTINKVGFPDRVGAFYVSLAKVYLNRVLQTTNDPYSPPKPDVMEALNCFKLATEADPNNPEAWKGYGFLLEKLKRKEESQAAFLKAVSLAPNDPDLKVQSTPSLK